MPQGWECPKCGAVYSPWVARCSNCTGTKKSTFTLKTTWQGICGGCGQPTDSGSTHACRGLTGTFNART